MSQGAPTVRASDGWSLRQGIILVCCSCMLGWGCKVIYSAARSSTPEHAARSGEAPSPSVEAGCKTCGADAPKSFSHAVLPRSTQAVRAYLQAVESNGVEEEDVIELRALIAAGSADDQVDAAVYAVSAAAGWFKVTADARTQREVLAVIHDAAGDARSRVRESAIRVIDELDGDL